MKQKSVTFLDELMQYTGIENQDKLKTAKTIGDNVLRCCKLRLSQTN